MSKRQRIAFASRLADLLGSLGCTVVTCPGPQHRRGDLLVRDPAGGPWYRLRVTEVAEPPAGVAESIAAIERGEVE